MPSDPISEINEAKENAVAAQQAGDYAAALRHTETAFILICALPNSEFDRERLEWDRESIKTLLEYLQAKVSAKPSDGSARNSLFRPTPILYQRG